MNDHTIRVNTLMLSGGVNMSSPSDQPPPTIDSVRFNET